MKRKIISALLGGILAATAAVSASAVEATKELTDVYPDNSTEVTAKIVNPGAVSYVITIPATADFGTLTVPENTENDNYTFYGFQVEATELNIVNGTAVSVWLKDGSSSDGQFYITQKNAPDASNPFTIEYDVYDAVVDASSLESYTPVNKTSQGANGYHLVTFAANQQGAVQDVTLALNQNALAGQDLAAIAGDYSGTIAFHSSLISLGG